MSAVAVSVADVFTVLGFSIVALILVVLILAFIVARDVDDLALQIRVVNDVRVDDPQGADPAAREVPGTAGNER